MALKELAKVPVQLPSPDQVRARFDDLEVILTKDVDQGRAALRRLFRNGRIRLDPQPQGIYLARSELLPLGFMLETTTPRNRAGASVHNLSCAGRI